MNKEERKDSKEMSSSSPSVPSVASSGVAGHTNYEAWGKKASNLLKELDEEDDIEKRSAEGALGLDGKYASSEAEAKERSKSKRLDEMKRKLEGYRERENNIIQTIEKLDFSSDSKQYIITRKDIDAGRRLLNLTDVKGPGTIILSQDLSLLENIVPANSTLTPKKYADDAENQNPPGYKDDDHKNSTVLGLIKVSLSNLKDCTVIVRCKILTGLIEVSYCTNVTIRIEKEATVSTIQADLSQELKLQFYDVPSVTAGTKSLWGENSSDRIYHAGVRQMSIEIYQHGFLVMGKNDIDCLTDGATAIGNATAEEVQFVTSVVDEQLITERILQNNSAQTNNSRMTAREFRQHEENKEKVQKQMEEHVKQSVKIITKDKNKEDFVSSSPPVIPSNDDDVVEEVYTDVTKYEKQAIQEECELQKKKGNEAFSSGEYAQAVLFYSLGLDKAAELQTSTLDFAHILYSNRAACFLKLGHFDKALEDTDQALKLDSTFVKALFRRGLAYHAMKNYSEALLVLAKAHEFEPKNKQIKQALQFAEVGHTREMRKRMNG